MTPLAVAYYKKETQPLVAIHFRSLTQAVSKRKAQKLSAKDEANLYIGLLEYFRIYTRLKEDEVKSIIARIEGYLDAPVAPVIPPSDPVIIPPPVLPEKPSPAVSEAPENTSPISPTSIAKPEETFTLPAPEPIREVVPAVSTKPQTEVKHIL